MIAFVISYNRLTLLKNICAELEKRGCEPVIVDNASTYDPLIDWLIKCPYKLLRLNKNIGYKSVWDSWALEKTRGERYIVTDPDLDISGVPLDMVEVLNAGLDKYPEYPKCGLSLKIDDLPLWPKLDDVRRIEAKYWKTKLDDMYYKAMTDTTLALYRENVVAHTLEAMRTEKPYTAVHLPWYYDKLADLPEDERYYFQTANDSSSGKHRIE